MMDALMDKFGFKLKNTTKISELDSIAFEYEHVKTKAKVFIIKAPTTNKSFGIAFRTPVTDSTGVAHILEHSVLCGSKKYPVKEAFSELMKGSLANFLNAFTYPDKTVYPFATENNKDFHNLMDVYLDVVFNPLLDKRTFRQEGWRIGSEGDSFKYSGVVFNEMKGVFSSPDGMQARYAFDELFPDTEYHFESGGDPKSIPALTYEQFVTYHHTYYHPSNSYTLVHGDMDIEETLEHLAEYFDQFEYQEPAVSVAKPVKWDKPKNVVRKYMSEKKENASVVTINWVLPEIDTGLDVLKYALLHVVLISSNAGVLKNKLLDSKLGERFAGYGLSMEEIMPSLSIGLFGVEEKNLGKVEALMMKTIEEFVAMEVPPSNLQASINQLEFTLKDPGIMYSEGIDIFCSMLANWLYGRDPLERVMFAKALKELKKQVADDPRFVQKLAKDLLLDNAHRLRLDLVPDPSLERKLQEEEEKMLQRELKGLTAMERKEIKKRDEELKVWQGKPDSRKALDTLPRLEKSELNTKVRKVKKRVGNEEGVKILWHKLPTQDVERVSMRFNISHLNFEDLQWLSLACGLITRLGTKNYTREELAIALDEHTGGVSINLAWLKPYKIDRLDIYQAVSFRTLTKKLPATWKLLKEMLENPDFTRVELLKDSIKLFRANTESSVITSGNRYAVGRALGKISKEAMLTEYLNGIEYLYFLRKVEKLCEEDIEQVVDKLTSVYSRSLNSDCIVGYTYEKESESRDKLLQKFLRDLPKKKGKKEKKQETVNEIKSEDSGKMIDEVFIIPSQVNYVATAYDLKNTDIESDGSFPIVASVLDNTILWKQVRMKGGAYGVYTYADLDNRSLAFASFRDPNVAKTIDAFRNISKSLVDYEADNAEMLKILTGVIGGQDGYIKPSKMGALSLDWYLTGISDKERQRKRDTLLNTDSKVFKKVSRELKKAKTVTVVVGSKEAVAKAKNLDLPESSWVQLV